MHVEQGQSETRPHKPERRRTYNRRTEDQVAPPYYDTFARIAAALESIEDLLRTHLPELVRAAAPAPPPAKRSRPAKDIPRSRPEH